MIRQSSRRDTTMTIPETDTPQSQREQTLRLHIGTAQPAIRTKSDWLRTAVFHPTLHP